MRFAASLLICALIGGGAFLLGYSVLPGEVFFWTFISTVGTAAFLVPRPSVSLVESIRMVGLWDLMAPVVLVVFATVNNPADLTLNSLRLVFLVLFFVGASTASRLLFWRAKK
jgi:hypothetical protein